MTNINNDNIKSMLDNMLSQIEEEIPPMHQAHAKSALMDSIQNFNHYMTKPAPTDPTSVPGGSGASVTFSCPACGNSLSVKKR